MHTKEWHEERRKGLGGSEVSALFDASPYLSKLALYTSKVSPAKADEDTKPWQEWGHRMEPALRKKYADVTGSIVLEADEHLQDSEVPYMRANPDSLVADPSEPTKAVRGLELKTGWAFQAVEDWADGAVPMYYQVQCQHYMAVSGLREWDICSFIPALMRNGGDPFVIRRIDRSDRFIAELRKRCKAFWEDHVVPRVPPPADGHRSTRGALAILWPEDNGDTLSLDDSLVALGDRVSEIAGMQRELKKERETLENKIKAAIGTATYATLPDGSGWSYKAVEVKPSVRAGYRFRKLVRRSADSMAKAMNEK